jgi:hypothetical protein
MGGAALGTLGADPLDLRAPFHGRQLLTRRPRPIVGGLRIRPGRRKLCYQVLNLVPEPVGAFTLRIPSLLGPFGAFSLVCKSLFGQISAFFGRDPALPLRCSDLLGPISAGFGLIGPGFCSISSPPLSISNLLGAIGTMASRAKLLSQSGKSFLKDTWIDPGCFLPWPCLSGLSQPFGGHEYPYRPITVIPG